MYTDPPTVLCKYFVDGQFVGESTYPLWRTNGDVMRWLPNLLWCCPHCGEAWGRILFESSDPKVGHEWNAHMRPCERCGDGRLVDPEALYDAAHDLLTREFLLAMQKGDWPA